MPATAGPPARRNRRPVGSCAVSDLLKAIVLGTIQGLTEFLPISSSAHLRIFPELFGWGDPGAAFTAVIQIGTELAVLIYFRKDIWRIGSAWVLSLVQAGVARQFDARMGWFIIIGSLPIVVLGVLLKDVIERGLPQPVDHRHHADRDGRRARPRRPRSAPTTARSGRSPSRTPC